jgi:uncharacterized protein (TIGR02145 family)
MKRFMVFIILFFACNKKDRSWNLLKKPEITTSAITNIGTDAATGGGSIISDGGSAITRRGVCFGTNSMPTIDNTSTNDQGGSGVFTSSLSGLKPNTLYHVRAYAINSVGVAYGNVISFTTITGVTDLNCASAINNGTLTSGIAASNVSSAVPYTGGNGGTYSAQTVASTGVTGLTARLFAGNFANGSGYLGFTITGTPSSAGTASFALSIGGQSCSLSRTVNSLAGSITTLNCGSATNNGTLIQGAAAGGVSSSMFYLGGNGGNYSAQSVNSTGVTGLTATLPAGTFANGSGSLTYTITGTPSSGGTASFALSIGGQSCTLIRTVNGGSPAGCGAMNVHNSTLTYGSMTDQDGNVYKTLVIVTQEWMVENLRARTYRNGVVIPEVTDAATWGGLTTGASCWYNNDSATYACPFGRLYNWYAVASSNNVCPTGWHVPTDAEWTTLENQLGGSSIAGGKMKSTGTLYWQSPNTSADNSSGFSGLAGGSRNNNGAFGNFGYDGYWWSSSENNTYSALSRLMNYNNGNTYSTNANKSVGFSVRCMRD